MKRLVYIMIPLVLALNVQGQNLAEVFANDENISHEIWLDESLGESTRFSFFNFTRFRVDYTSDSQNEILSYSTVSYRFGRGLSLAGGGFITNQGFTPVVAASYFFQNDVWMVNLFPSVEIVEDPNMEVFFTFQFRPRINNKLRFFSRLMLNSNFDFQQHNFSEQNLRVGLDYKSFQFGLGGDFTQIPVFDSTDSNVVNTDFNMNFGVFLRKEF